MEERLFSEQEKLLIAETLKNCCVFQVNDLHRSVEYYNKTLGFDCEEVNTDIEKYAIVSKANTQIKLIQLTIKLEHDQRSSTADEISDAYFLVDDVDKVFYELKLNHAIILIAPYIHPYGIKEFVACDIDGFKLSFGEAV